MGCTLRYNLHLIREATLEDQDFVALIIRKSRIALILDRVYSIQFFLIYQIYLRKKTKLYNLKLYLSLPLVISEISSLKTFYVWSNESMNWIAKIILLVPQKKSQLNQSKLPSVWWHVNVFEMHEITFYVNG